MSRFTNLRHGHAIRGKKSAEYQCWSDIKTRCLRENSKAFPYYGGRGITICDRWKNSFDNFIADVGPRPTPKHTIDRHPNKDGNYEPGNVRWATRREQVDNRRSTRTVVLDGETISVSEGCRRLGLNRKVVCGRLDRGWTPERALTPSLWKNPSQNKKKETR